MWGWLYSLNVSCFIISFKVYDFYPSYLPDNIEDIVPLMILLDFERSDNEENEDTKKTEDLPRGQLDELDKTEKCNNDHIFDMLKVSFILQRI